jgi:integrase
MSRQIHRLTQIQVDKARPFEEVVPVADVKVTNTQDRPTQVRTMRKFKAALRIVHDPNMVMRDGRPSIVKRRTRWLADGGSLWVKVMPSQTDPDGYSASYVFRYSLPEQKTSANGKTYQRQRHMGLGSCHTLRLDEAREKARECRKMLLDGIDPITAKRGRAADALVAEKKLKTWDAVVAEYVLRNGDRWSKVHRANVIQSLRDWISPVIGNVPIADVDNQLAVKALTDVYDKKPVTCGRLIGRCADVYAHAVFHGYAPDPNPFRYKDHLEIRFPHKTEVKHLPALKFDRMPSLWRKLIQIEGLASLALQWTTLTVARTNETLAARACEIDRERQLWRVPKSHLKNRRHMADDDFLQPLTDEAMAIMAKLGRREPHERLFPLAVDSGVMLDVIQSINADVTVHGTTRGAFKSWSEEATDTDSKVVEACMSHKVGTAVDLAYHRGPQFVEKKRRHLALWANYVTGRMASADVVPMVGKRT